jgi:hypothetical protein
MKPSAHEHEERMRTRQATQVRQPATAGQPLDLERRINACWLRFWKPVYPNIPPPTTGGSLESKVLSLESAGHSPQSTLRRPESPTQDSRLKTRDSARRPRAAADYLSRFLCAGFVLALLVSACAGPRPLKGGKATTTRSQAGLIQQTVAQGENASQPSKQNQETIKVRSYTLPAATRIEQCPAWEGERPREPKLEPRKSGLASTLALPGKHFWREQSGWSAAACR